MTATESAREAFGSQIAVYNPNDAEIARVETEYMPLLTDPEAANTPEGYKAVAKALGVVVGMRTSVDKYRLKLNEGFRNWIKANDDEAKRITSNIRKIEDPLRAKKEAADAAREKATREKAEAEKALLEAQQKAAKEAEEARLKAIRDEDAARLKAEREELAKQRAEFERKQAEENERKRLEQAERDRIENAEREERRLAQKKIDEENAAERKRLADERAKVEADARQVREAKERADREEFQKLVAIEAKEKAEREAAERVKQQQAEAERIKAEEAAEAKRIADAKPDVEKIRQFGKRLSQVECGKLTSAEANAFVGKILNELTRIQESCAAFTIAKRKPARSKETVA